MSENEAVKTLDYRTPSWGRSVDIRSKLPNGRFAGRFFGSHLGVGDLLILKSDGPTGAATYRVTAIIDKPFDPGDLFYFEAEFNQRWPHAEQQEA